MLYGSYPIAHCRSPYKVVQYLAERSWPPLQVALGLGAGISVDNMLPDDLAYADPSSAAGTSSGQQQHQKRQEHQEGGMDEGKLQVAEGVACMAANQHGWHAATAADEAGVAATWTAMSLCEGLAKRRQWCNRRGGRLDTYRAANWILRGALAGGKGIGLCFLPPSMSGCGAGTGQVPTCPHFARDPQAAANVDAV